MLCLPVSIMSAAVTLPAAEDAIYSGDTVVIVRDGVELGMRDKPEATLKTGDKLHVTEVRGEWIGGYSESNGKRRVGWVHRNDAKLDVAPAGPVTTIELPDTPDDAQAVTALKELGVKLELNDQGNVHTADATESKLEDAGVKHLGGLAQLTVLDLSGRPVTDQALASLAGLKVLQTLYLNDTQVGDQGLQAIAGLVNLETLAVQKTKVTGAGLAHLEKLQHLMVLNLSHCAVGDDALKHLQQLPVLEVLTLPGTKVTSAGMEHLKPLPKLRVLNLIDCDVDDAGLEPLKSVSNLRMLYVRGTKVSQEGIEDMNSAAPSLAVFD
jgi:hypothetical protein